MIKLDDIKQEKKCGKVFYVLPGRRTTESVKHAKEVLAEIHNLTTRAESRAKNKNRSVI